jgi:hypothetical protein
LVLVPNLDVTYVAITTNRFGLAKDLDERAIAKSLTDQCGQDFPDSRFWAD